PVQRAPAGGPPLPPRPLPGLPARPVRPAPPLSSPLLIPRRQAPLMTASTARRHPTTRLLDLFRKPRRDRQRKKPRDHYRPFVERLEDRWVPAVNVLDLSGSPTAAGSVNGALFTVLNNNNFNTSTGTGVIQPFLRVQNNGI